MPKADLTPSLLPQLDPKSKKKGEIEIVASEMNPAKS